MYASLASFVRDARHNRILAIPAGLYAVRPAGSQQQGLAPSRTCACVLQACGTGGQPGFSTPLLAPFK